MQRIDVYLLDLESYCVHSFNIRVDVSWLFGKNTTFVHQKLIYILWGFIIAYIIVDLFNAMNHPFLALFTKCEFSQWLSMNRDPIISTLDFRVGRTPVINKKYTRTNLLYINIKSVRELFYLSNTILSVF